MSPPNIGAKATAVVAGSFLTGAMVCLSGVVIPVFLDTDTDAKHLLRQWVRVYHYGHIYMPAMCIVTCGLYGYIALNCVQRRTYMLAGLCTFAMVPFTWIFMAATNNDLFHLDGLSTLSPMELESVNEIVIRWSWLHLFRCLFPMAGALLGFSRLLQDLGV